MRHYQCLFYALDRWHAEGGYVKLRKSAHWCVPHVLHESRDGQLTHFVPRADLPHAKKSVCGFPGSVQTADTTAAEPMTLPGIFLGALILLVGGAVWAVKQVLIKR